MLALLLLAYIFNFLDRQILGILAQPIKADLKLTDTEFGAIGGLAFASSIRCSACRSPILPTAPAAARVIAGALAVWSGFTALVRHWRPAYWQLFLFRLGVGRRRGRRSCAVLCADRRLFPARAARPGAGASSRSAIPLGLAAGTLLGAYLATADRLAGGVHCHGRRRHRCSRPFCLFRARPAARQDGRGEAAPLGQVFPLLARKPTFWLMAFAAS